MVKILGVIFFTGNVYHPKDPCFTPFPGHHSCKSLQYDKGEQLGKKPAAAQGYTVEQIKHLPNMQGSGACYGRGL